MLIKRSLKNLIRSPFRTGGIVAILTVCVGLALIMLTVNGAAKNQLRSIQGEIGTEIEVRPAGQFAMMGGGEPLVEESVDKINDIAHVVSVQKSTQTRYTGDSLKSSIEPGTLGRRFGLGGGGGGFGGAGFTMPIIIMGFNPSTGVPVLMGGAQPEITQGRYFAIGEDNGNVVVAGQALAEKNGLDIGSEVSINGTSVQVIGIFTTGQRFADNMLVMPFGTVQRLFDLKGVTSVTVVADTVNNVDGVVNAIRGIFDTATADIATSTQAYERINTPLVNANNASQTGMIATFAVAAVVILFSVALMVRQRVREIGILKAIGASNWHIGFQFSLEALAMSVVAAIIGSLISFALAQRVANLLSTGLTSTQGAAGFARGEGFFGGGGITRFAGINVAVSPEIFLYALGMAIVLAVAASIFPSWYISRIKPAEVLRNE